MGDIARELTRRGFFAASAVAWVDVLAMSSALTDPPPLTIWKGLAGGATTGLFATFEEAVMYNLAQALGVSLHELRRPVGTTRRIGTE